MTWLLWFFLLAVWMVFVYLMFTLYRYGRKNKQTRYPLEDLLLGFDSILKGPWSSSPMTKRTGENPLKAVGETSNQDALDSIFRPRTDEDAEKKPGVTIIVEDDSPEESPQSRNDKDEIIRTIIVEEDNPEESPRRKRKKRGVI